MSEAPRPRRPSLRDPRALESLGGGSDPVARIQAAHETAAALVAAGREAADPEVLSRLVGITDEIGLSTLANLWASRPARSLPGALWRLYLLREWVQRDPDTAAREYTAGIRHTEPNHVVAGVDPPGPDEIRLVVDQIIGGVFRGDFSVALDRAAAFCLVVMSGRADMVEGPRAARLAGRLQTMASDLSASAEMWRAGTLD